MKQICLEVPTQEQPWHNTTMHFSNMRLHEKLYSSNFCMKCNVLRLSILGCGSMYLVDCNSVVEVPPASSSKQYFFKMMVIDYQTTQHDIQQDLQP